MVKQFADVSTCNNHLFQESRDLIIPWIRNSQLTFYSEIFALQAFLQELKYDFTNSLCKACFSNVNSLNNIGAQDKLDCQLKCSRYLLSLRDKNENLTRQGYIICIEQITDNA